MCDLFNGTENLLAITILPKAIASKTTFGKSSLSIEGKIRQSSAAIKSKMLFSTPTNLQNFSKPLFNFFF